MCEVVRLSSSDEEEEVRDDGCSWAGLRRKYTPPKKWWSNGGVLLEAASDAVQREEVGIQAGTSSHRGKRARPLKRMQQGPARKLPRQKVENLNTVKKELAKIKNKVDSLLSCVERLENKEKPQGRKRGRPPKKQGESSNDKQTAASNTGYGSSTSQSSGGRGCYQAKQKEGMKTEEEGNPLPDMEDTIMQFNKQRNNRTYKPAKRRVSWAPTVTVWGSTGSPA
ncbi:RNA-binding Raly-like protein [Trichosurus vulpecula]|uniref:RNA-binding Raly-like protein n=1 Tax=Trichosurus vulpecula TaxID=9337 RepID=UPI00186B3FA5|nr:RNA-binding Raly-like protein [Trichosurus vulpecula]